MNERNVRTMTRPTNDPATWTGIVTEIPTRRTRTGLPRLNQSIIVWLLVAASFPASRLISPNFPSWEQFNSVIALGLFLTVIAFGQGLVILTGGIDLSVPAVVSLGAFSTGYFASDGIPTIFAVLLGVTVASLVGLLNGVVIARTTFPPFIVTLAISGMATALLLGFSKGAAGQASPPELTEIFIRSNNVLGIPITVIAFVIVVILGFCIQSRTRFGRSLYAIGNSVPAARIAGLRVRVNTVFAYWIAAASYGLAGVLLLGYGSGSDLNIGASWLLPSIAAVVVGGSLISGGYGNFLGTAGAALFLTILSIDISAAGFSEGLKQVLYGAVIFLALLLTKLGGARR